ncbi:phosphatase PAP2 family protein [Paenibacillus rhizovicinus]|uniref:Phosphatase PAP2 family protein n=1 Tax=Paenibacillus rhizovicinus TaxID=2704463 RepID=A0A6C0P5L1_9BACL|nr:phosphatase PAP2 family protein [Paenibacillus rhizovicinus]QHW33641.1 phosphatase PAP2 family protein [Paenibacillus rhizovicinus]
MRTPKLTLIMEGFTNAGAGISVTIIAACLLIILAVIGYRRELYVYAGVIGASSLLNLLLKSLFHRTRPDINRIIDAAGYSFPSGHSMAAFTMYALTVYFLWKHVRYGWLRIIVVSAGSFMIIMIGLSRIYLGVHYPSDVIGGYLISAAWLAASIGGYEHFLAERWKSKK